MTDEHNEATAPRRGRPPRAPEAVSVQEDATPRASRRKRGPVGGFTLKLDAPARSGFVRRFVNDDPARIRAMEELGYTLVNERASDGASRTEGQGTRISRHAGKDENGKAFQTVLMETPVEEYQLGLEDKEQARKPFEDAITRSADTTGQVPDAYQPGQSTIRRSG